VISDSTCGPSPEQPGMIESLPSASQDFVRSLGGDYGLTSVLLYAAGAQAGRKGHSLQLGPSAPIVRPTLFLLPFAPPGYGKSLGTEKVFAPNYELEKESGARQLKHRRKYEAAITIRKWMINDLDKAARQEPDNKDLRKRLSRVRSGLRAQIAALQRKANWNGRSISTDVTLAGMRDELWQAPDTNASLILADGRHFLEKLLGTSSGVATSGLRSLLLSGFSGDTLRFVKSSGTREIVLKDPQLTIMAAGQSDLGHRLFNSEGYAESGLGSRFLAFFFDRLDAPHGELGTELAKAWKDQIRRIASSKMANSRAVRWELDTAARARLKLSFSAFRELASASHISSLRSGFWSRAGEQLQRLTLVRALIGWQEGANPIISEEIVYGAQIFLAHAWNHLEKGITLSSLPIVPQKEVEQLRQAIRNAGGELPTEPTKRTSDRYGLSKEKVRKIASLCPTLFQVKDKPRGGQRGRPMEIVALVE